MTLKLSLTKSMGIRKAVEAMRLVMSPKKTVSCFSFGLICYKSSFRTWKRNIDFTSEAPIARRIPKAICVGRSATWKLNLWKIEKDQKKSAGAM